MTNLIPVHCDECGRSFRVKEEFGGKRGKCPKCGAIVQVPRRAEPRSERAASHSKTQGAIGAGQRDEGRRRQRVLRLAACAGIAIAIVLLWCGVLVVKERRALRAAEAAKAEKQRSLKEANARAAALAAEATEALRAGNLDLAREKLDAARNVPSANTARVRAIGEQMACAIEPGRVRAVLMRVSDAAFGRFAEDGQMPKELVFGLGRLDEMVAATARSQSAEVAEARNLRRRQRQGWSRVIRSRS